MVFNKDIKLRKLFGFCKMLKHERKAKTLLSFLIFTGKLTFAKFVFSHCFIFPKQNKETKTSFIFSSVQFSSVAQSCLGVCDGQGGLACFLLNILKIFF